MVNGMYGQGLRDVGDLGNCGCQTNVAETAGGFDLSDIPMWAWIAAAAGAFLLLSKKQGR